jgi:hypothetical protein
VARIRTIKPEFFRHEGLQDLERSNPGSCCMLVFAGLFTVADKSGRFEWKPRTLKLDILPFLDFDMDKTLGLLRKAGFVVQYEVNGRLYGLIPSFSGHQRITGKEATTPSRYPSPDEGNIREISGKHPVAQEREREKERKVPSEPIVRSDSIHESSGPHQPVRLAEEPERTGKPPEQEPAIMTFPLADKSDYPLTAAQLAELSSLYPGVDPEQELLKAKGWLIANPTRRKTRRGIARFIHGWLARAQDRGNGSKAPPPGRFDACAYLDQKIAEAEAEEHGQSGSD